MNERILKTKDVCELLQVSPTTLWRWRKSGQFPEPLSMAHSSYQGWREKTIGEWLDNNFQVKN